MKQKIVLNRFYHRERWRIGFAFDWDDRIVAIIRTIKGSRYSATKKCWYADDNEETLKSILKALRDQADIDISKISSGHTAGKKNFEDPPHPEKESEAASMLLPQVTLRQLDTGNDKSSSSENPGAGSDAGSRLKRYGPVEFTISETEDLLIVRFTGRYDKEWIEELKSYGQARFDSGKSEYLLGWSRMKVDSLSDYFSSKGVEVIVKRASVTEAVKEQREERGTEIRERVLCDEAMSGIENVRRYLTEKRYSRNTLEVYLSLLELFFKYFSGVEPGDISEEDISDFFNDYIILHNYSASYHNQLISAIKLYYRLNESKSIDSSALGRPRRSRALPKVFSKDEVKRILNSSRNDKHRLLLWIIYSCGLRRSEVINIRLKDLDRERGILNIREAKGMKDRIVPVPVMVWEKIDEYRLSYRPETWLFEGQAGGKYSAESVYRVFKLALKNAGIKKDVGVHSLRHSYATHLHENGLDIRYIQELLGHRSTRTTEIYTHVSRRNLVLVRSPIEDLGLK